MRYKNAELYNVQEMLQGDGLSVLTEPTLDSLRAAAGDPDSVWGAEDAQGLWFCRIPNALRLTLNTSAQLNALQATGAELRFNLTGEQARVVLKCQQAPVVAEVYQGGFYVGWHMIDTDPTEIVIRLPERLEQLEQLARTHHMAFDARLTRVLLPWRPPTRLVDFQAQCEPPRRGQTPSQRYLVYGSSITHGNASVRPSAMYAHRTAQLLGADLINLGFGGGAHLEPQLADYIAGRTDWHFASLELGINLLRAIEVEEFARRVDYFVERIARAHPDKWIFCMDLFTVEEDLLGDPKVEAFRAVVADKVASLKLPRLIHVSGRELLTSVHGLTTDLVHPSPFGMEEIAQRLSGRMREIMGPTEI